MYYILTDEVDNNTFRKEIHRQLVKLYLADPSCIAFCHCFRIPGSYNLKNNKTVKTRLYKTSNEITYRIDEFSWVDKILKDEKYLRKSLNKSSETSKLKAPKKLLKSDEKSEKKTSAVAEKLNEDIINLYKLDYESHDNANSRNKHLLIDLHNYYVRHNGLAVGVRHNYFTIMAYVLKNSNFNEDEAINYIKKYISESHSYYSEAISDINRAFSNEESYHYRNKTIADWLKFT